MTDVLHDLGDAEVRFNLQLATRAWQTLVALGEEPEPTGS